MECPICSGEPGEQFTAKYVDAVKCSKCGHIYASNVPEDHGVQESADPEARLRQYGARNVRLISRWQRDGFISRGSRILDFGAGTGHVLRSLVAEAPDFELDIHCVEADSKAAAFLKTQGFVVHSQLSDATPGYDAILLIELVEHLSDPVVFLERIGQYLAPGGKIFLTTPIGETRTGNRHLTTYDTAEHVQFWTEGSFFLACRKAGLEFNSINPGIMYPRKNKLDAFLRDAAQGVRDYFQGTRHLVGYAYRR